MESVIKLANLDQTGKTRCVGGWGRGQMGSYETLPRPQDTEINFSEYFSLLDLL